MAAAGAELCELALGMLQKAGNEVEDDTARRRLVEQIRTERHWEPEECRQPWWHEHQLPRRTLRRLNPAWWARRWQATVVVRLAHPPGPGRHLGDVDQIKMMLDGQQMGRLDYQICHACRMIANLPM